MKMEQSREEIYTIDGGLIQSLFTSHLAWRAAAYCYIAIHSVFMLIAFWMLCAHQLNSFWMTIEEELLKGQLEFLPVLTCCFVWCCWTRWQFDRAKRREEERMRKEEEQVARHQPTYDEMIEIGDERTIFNQH
jgi:uncharacterized membrane protein YwzB